MSSDSSHSCPSTDSATATAAGVLLLTFWRVRGAPPAAQEVSMSFFSSLHTSGVSRALVRFFREFQIPASLLAPFGCLRMAGAFSLRPSSSRRTLFGLRLSPHERGR